MRRGRARRPAPVSEAAFRRPMAIVAIKQFGSGETYPVCPRCRITMEREYQNFCDRCGQALDWRQYAHAGILLLSGGVKGPSKGS